MRCDNVCLPGYDIYPGTECHHKQASVTTAQVTDGLPGDSKKQPAELREGSETEYRSRTERDKDSVVYT